MTFYPGETLKSIKITGNFLERYGLKPDKLYDRIKTNGTRGGLGQFFQPYHGTIDFDSLREQGRFLTERPVRLIPSFIPFSFTKCKYKVVESDLSKYQQWFDMYGLNWLNFDIRVTTNEVVTEFMSDCYNHGIPPEESTVFMAQLARLGLVEQIGV